MAINSKETVPHNQGDYIQFPKLMISSVNNAVVLFSKNRVGVVVVGGGVDYVGDYSANWVMDNFTDYKGTIQLTNRPDHD